jgi:drug/metabolite transporter (DMT)-like permease
MVMSALKMPSEVVRADSNVSSVDSVFQKDIVKIDSEIKPLSPLVWIPMSLSIAVLIAVNNEIKSSISHFHFNARLLQTPGSLIANFTTIFLIKLWDREDEENKPLLKSNESANTACTDLESREVISKAQTYYQLVKANLLIILLLILMNIVNYWATIESLFYAGEANVNTGVVVSMFSLKPIMSACLFYLWFNQKLKLFDIWGICVCIMAVVIITLSKSDSNSLKPDEFTDFVKAMLLMFMAVSIICLRNALHRKYFVKDQPATNMIFIHNFVNF